MTTLTIPPHIETYFEVHQEEKELFYNNFQKLVSSIEDKIDDVNIPHIKPKNKWVEFAEHYSEIGKDECPNVDFGKIIRDGREQFRNNFQF